MVRVSGTIRKVEEEAIRRARAAILKAEKEAAGRVGTGLAALLRVEDEKQENSNLGLDNDQVATGNIEDDDEEVDDSEEED